MWLLDYLIEFALSLVIASVLGYFIFLTNAPTAASGKGPQSVDDAAEGSTRYGRAGTVRWVSVVQRWAAAAVLGGGSSDQAVWSDRLAYVLDRVLVGAAQGVQRRYNLLPQLPVLRVTRLVLGAHRAAHGRSHSADVEALDLGESSAAASMLLPAASHNAAPQNCAGTVLPSIDSVTSCEFGSSPATREFRLALSFVDQFFHLQLFGEIPLLFGLPPQLRIPPDVLTMRCRVDVSKVTFRSGLCLRMHGCRWELFFDGPPEFDAEISVSAPSARHSSAGPSQAASDAKAGDLLKLAITRSIQQLCFPNVLVATFQRAAPHVSFARERLQLDSI